MTLLLDANAYTALLAGDQAVHAKIGHASRVMMSVIVIVIGELEYGFRYRTRLKQNLALLDAFLQEPFLTVVTISRDTTQLYGALTAHLRKAGTKIPSNDAWIAAQAIEQRATLISRDRHMRRVDGLDLVAW